MITLSSAIQNAIAAQEVWQVKLISLEIGDTTYFITDHYKDVVVGTDTYLGNGRLLSVTNVKEGIDNASQTISISLSGIESTFRQDVIQADAIGGTVTIRQAFLNITTGALLDSLEIYSGFIWSISTNEDRSADALMPSMDNRTFTLTAEVRSLQFLLETSPGRFTEDNSNKQNVSTDASMEFVQSLNGVELPFGGSR